MKIIDIRILGTDNLEISNEFFKTVKDLRFNPRVVHIEILSNYPLNLNEQDEEDSNEEQEIDFSQLRPIKRVRKGSTMNLNPDPPHRAQYEELIQQSSKKETVYE